MENDKRVISAAAIPTVFALFVFLFLGLSALGTRVLAQETNPKKCPELVKAEADLKAAEDAEFEAEKSWNRSRNELAEAERALDRAVREAIRKALDPDEAKEELPKVRKAEQDTEDARRALEAAEGARSGQRSDQSIKKAQDDLDQKKMDERGVKESVLSKLGYMGPAMELLRQKQAEFDNAKNDLKEKTAAREKAEEEVRRIKCPPKKPPVIPKIPIPRIPSWWFHIGYSYLRAPDEDAKNLNGFNASLAYCVRPWIAAKADLTYGYGKEAENVEVIGRVGGSEVTYQGLRLHRFLYLFGPQLNAQVSNKLQVFGEALFGGVHDTTKFRLGTTTTTVSANAFAAGFGGGVDVKIGKRLFVRPAQLRYVLTHFGGQTQSNFQFAAGIGFTFGGK